MKIIYSKDDREITVQDDSQTLLEISLANNIPHFHACGGHAICSTCRVMVYQGAENLSPPNEAEQKLAARKGWNSGLIRLACQTRPQGDVILRRLVLDDEDARLVKAESSPRSRGEQKDLAVLFTDLENFTAFSEKALPYDVIHLLDRHFARMGEAVLENHGFIDKYIGDGLMAVFGLEQEDPAEKCLDAVRAALRMLSEQEKLNGYFEREFAVRLNMRIGIHFGRVICGEFGHPKKRQFTVLGDTVNMASRLEGITKQTHTRLLVSETVHQQVKDRVLLGGSFKTAIKGKEGDFEVFEIKALLP